MSCRRLSENVVDMQQIFTSAWLGIEEECISMTCDLESVAPKSAYLTELAGLDEGKEQLDTYVKRYFHYFRTQIYKVATAEYSKRVEEENKKRARKEYKEYHKTVRESTWRIRHPFAAEGVDIFWLCAHAPTVLDAMDKKTIATTFSHAEVKGFEAVALKAVVQYIANRIRNLVRMTEPTARTYSPL